jgi:DNA-binding NarL/FixJ family response regulator
MMEASETELIKTVRVLHGGQKYVTPTLVVQLFAANAPAPARVLANLFAALTGREEQVLALIADGLSNREIGGRLELSEKTIKHYVTAVMHKLEVRTRVQAALLAQAKFAG